MDDARPAARVALVGGDGPDGDSWARSLRTRGVEVLQVRPGEEFDGTHFDWAIVFTPSESATRALEQTTRSVGSVPLTLLVSKGPGLHPETRLFQVLAGAKREWEGTFDALTDALAIIEPDGRLRRVNRAFAQMVGRDWAELIGRPYSDFIRTTLQGSRDPVAQSLATGARIVVETDLAEISGRWLLSTGPLEDSEREAGIVIVLKDVTSLHEQRARLLLAARLRDVGLLAAGVAHEINTPLASISLRAESLLKLSQGSALDRAGETDRFSRYLQTIMDETQRCKKIVASLLEFSRTGPVTRREVDLNEVVKRTAELLSHEVRRKQVNLVLCLQPDLPLVMGDQGQLGQAAFALAVNSVEAVARGGKVQLLTATQGEGVTLTVVDDGVGIPRENFGKIFVPFFTTKSSAVASGLGLAVVHGIVGASGGKVEVESEVGQGTKMHVWLPARPRTEPS